MNIVTGCTCYCPPADFATVVGDIVRGEIIYIGKIAGIVRRGSEIKNRTVSAFGAAAIAPDFCFVVSIWDQSCYGFRIIA